MTSPFRMTERSYQGDQRLFRTQFQIADKIIPKNSQKIISQNMIKKGQNRTTNVCISDLHVNKIFQNETKNEILEFFGNLAKNRKTQVEKNNNALNQRKI